MEDTHLYSAQEIETLRKKIMIYRQTLTALQTGHSIDDPLFTQDEIKSDLPQIPQLKGAAEKVGEEQSNPLDVYERQFKDFFKQIEVLNDTVKELNQDLSEVVDKFNKEGEISPPVPVTDPIVVQNPMEELDVIVPTSIEEFTQTKKQPLMTAVSKATQPPSFTQLHRLIREANAIQEETDDRISNQNLMIPTVEKEELRNNGIGFPRIESGASQHSTRQFGKVQMKTTVRLNKPKQQQEFLIPMHQTVNQRTVQKNEQPLEEELVVKILGAEQPSEPEALEKNPVEVELATEKLMEETTREEETISTALAEEKSVEAVPVGTEPVATALQEEPLLESETREEPQLEAELFEEQSIEVTLSEEKPLVMETPEKVSMETESIEKESLEDFPVTEQQEKKQKQTLSLFRLFRKRV